MKWRKQRRPALRLEFRMTIWLVVLLGASAAITLFAMAKLETQSVEQYSTDTASILASRRAASR
jgi:type VI protein secretion system component VasF